MTEPCKLSSWGANTRTVEPFWNSSSSVPCAIRTRKSHPSRFRFAVGPAVAPSTRPLRRIRLTSSRKRRIASIRLCAVYHTR